MQASDTDEFFRVLERVAKMFRMRGFDAEMKKRYWEGLEEFSLDSAIKALEFFEMNKPMFPRLPELREFIRARFTQRDATGVKGAAKNYERQEREHLQLLLQITPATSVADKTKYFEAMQSIGY